jgi:hypothetical protein
MKQNTRRFLLAVTIVLSANWLSSCKGFTKPDITATFTNTFTQTISPTQTSTITFMPAIRPTKTDTPTLTPTMTETPAYNLPGLYSINKCVSFFPFTSEPKLFIQFCLQTVQVNPDYTMKFNVNWVVGGTKVGGESTGVFKITNPSNHCDFIVDNLGNEYSHIGVGGAAANMDVVNTDKPSSGWFLFSPAKPGATSFTFRSMCDGIEIGGIVLRQGNFPTLTITPKPTLGTYNSPGTYWIYKCTFFIPQDNFPGASNVTLCVNTVVINDKLEMRFNVNWKINYGYIENWKKPSDANNYNIFLEDNLENDYQHIYTGGCAGQETVIVPYGKTGDCSGWFQFPQAKPGATSFQLVDLANHAAIENIILLPK